ncbi:MAG: DUF1232 domain-containing protein [Mailhella sp.]|nr:DUF1232 domain-containing protein [Mailhella sp.]
MNYDEQGRPIIDPEIVTEEKYQRAWSEKRFWAKLPRSARKLGRIGLRQALRLYYVLKRPDLPGKTRAMIYGALGYFILPTDILPDVLPILGFTDDLGLLAAVFMAASQYMDDEVNAKAEAKVIEWLGTEE